MTFFGIELIPEEKDPSTLQIVLVYLGLFLFCITCWALAAKYIIIPLYRLLFK